MKKRYLALLLVVQQLTSARDVTSEERIVKGDLAGGEQFPWMAAIFRNAFDSNAMRPTPNSHSFYCGGTILSSRVILTAAHCIHQMAHPYKISVYQYQPVDFLVVVGTSDLSPPLVTWRVERVVVHPLFNNASLENDLALLKLSQGLKLGRGVRAIEVRKRAVANGQMGVVAGWGDTCMQPPKVLPQTHLRFAWVRVLPVAACAAISVTLPVSESSILCVGPDLHISNGDSGGGLFVKRAKVTKVIGVVSFANPCKLNEPAVFVKLSSFYAWIAENVNKLNKN